jgi:hypothetical protein
MSETPPDLYPGLGLDLRHHEQEGDEIYPLGIHYNCWGSASEMLLVREVAMMIVMNQLTEKPDWHIKVFNDTISEKWIDEALAIPVESLYDDIVDTKRYEQEKLKTILDRKCLEYVRILFWPCRSLFTHILLVYQRATCKGQVL